MICDAPRDRLIEQLMREIVELKEKISLLEEQLGADRELLAGTRERCAQLEAELRDYKEIAEQTCNVSKGRAYIINSNLISDILKPLCKVLPYILYIF